MPDIASGLSFEHSDDGRARAGFRGSAGDCGVRAAAIVTGSDYRATYDALFARQKAYRAKSRKPAKRDRTASPRAGVARDVMHAHMIEAGADWIALASIGGDVVRVIDVAARWPRGRIVMRLARHYSVMIDGVNLDTWGQHPQKRVYGVWIIEGERDGVERSALPDCPPRQRLPRG